MVNDRYSRQKLFRPVGENGQKNLRIKHVLILGCGALGTTNAEMLVRAGIGKVTIIDRDYVEFSNLQRQQLFSEQDAIEQIPKAIAAKNRLSKINSDVEIDAYVMDATSSKIHPLLESVDMVIDATDNFDVRLMMNDLLQKQNITWIFGSCVGSMGMSYTIKPGQTPCMNCLLNSAPLPGATCDSVGIISPAVQMVAAHQTTEALKYLVDDFEAMRSSLVTFDLWNNNYQTINVNRAKKENCPTCGTNPSYPYLQYENQTKTEVLCGRETVQIRTGRDINIEDLATRLTKLGKVNLNPFLISLEYQSYRLVFFKDGRTLIHGTNSIEKAKRLYYQIIG